MFKIYKSQISNLFINNIKINKILQNIKYIIQRSIEKTLP